MQQRFKTFELYYKEIVHLLDAWDRTQGNIFRQPSPSEKSEHEDQLAGKKKLKDAKGNLFILILTSIFRNYKVLLKVKKKKRIKKNAKNKKPN